MYLTPPLLPAEAQIEAEGAKAGPRPKTNPWVIFTWLILIFFIFCMLLYFTYAFVSKLKPITISPSPTPIPLSSWQTYTNFKKNFQLSYPSNWSISEGPEQVQFVPLGAEKNMYRNTVAVIPDYKGTGSVKTLKDVEKVLESNGEDIYKIIGYRNDTNF